MSDICIYTTPEKLLHKQGKLENDSDHSESGEYYWQLGKLPKKLKEWNKIWFATKGFIRGYFIVDRIEYRESVELIFNCNSWRDLPDFQDYPIKHFQGFKYIDAINEEMV